MYGILAVAMLAVSIYNLFFLPKPEDDHAVKNAHSFALWEVIKEYMQQNRALLVIAFIVLYRFGEGLLLRMADPFFMDPVEQGGMAMAVTEIVTIKSFAAIPCTIIGGIIGGWLVKKYGLRKTFLPLSLCMCLPNLGYWYLAKTQGMADIAVFGFMLNRDVLWVVCLESLGYGIGFSAFFYYLHAIAVGENKTSLFAISTALMALGIYLPSAISGVVQEAVGYQSLFLLSFVLALPAICLLKFIPLEKGRTEGE
jgi:PAT family beta-lactamase induction signal transducer AmpG